MGPRVEIAVTGKNANERFCGIQIVTTNIMHYHNEFMDYVWSCVLSVHLLRIFLGSRHWGNIVLCSAKHTVNKIADVIGFIMLISEALGSGN